MRHWTGAHIAAMRRLRESFLDGSAGEGDYWKSEEDLVLYDQTFAQRIGWKWDAVMAELRVRGWAPKSQLAVDFGCGSGIAHRAVMEALPGQYRKLHLHDRSPMALRFALKKAAEAAPEMEVTPGLEFDRAQPFTLIVSHLLNELPEKARVELLALARQAQEILWVEAGTFADSRALIAMREELRGEFTSVAPCTHNYVCGMLTAENAPHWCHSFAKPPHPIFQDARWAEWSLELGIDLRSLPYSFLVMERGVREPHPDAGAARVIGRPRDFKGYSKVLSSEAEGVRNRTLQKRDAPRLLKSIQKGELAPVYRWEIEDGKIVGGELVHQPPEEKAEG